MARLSNDSESDEEEEDGAADEDDDEDDETAEEEEDEGAPPDELPPEAPPPPRLPLYRRNTASRQGMKLHTRPGGVVSESMADSFWPGCERPDFSWRGGVGWV